MGSLMAGWSTSPSRPDEVLKRSNSSVTKEEVEKFWRVKKLLVQEHLDEANRDAALSPRTRMARALRRTLPDSPSADLAWSGMTEEMDSQQKMTEGAMSMSLPEGKSRAWWTKSNWAFLNDPPSLVLKESKYVAQFEVATLGQLQPEHPAF